jgi:hypothetical protein
MNIIFHVKNCQNDEVFIDFWINWRILYVNGDPNLGLLFQYTSADHPIMFQAILA